MIHQMTDSFQCPAHKFTIDFVGSEKLLNTYARDICPTVFAAPQRTIDIQHEKWWQDEKNYNYENFNDISSEKQL